MLEGTPFATTCSIQKSLDTLYTARAMEEPSFHISFGAICAFWMKVLVEDILGEQGLQSVPQNLAGGMSLFNPSGLLRSTTASIEQIITSNIPFYLYLNRSSSEIMFYCTKLVVTIIQIFFIITICYYLLGSKTTLESSIKPYFH